MCNWPSPPIQSWNLIFRHAVNKAPANLAERHADASGAPSNQAAIAMEAIREAGDNGISYGSCLRIVLPSGEG